MGKYRYGSNFKVLKAIYIIRQGNKKGEVAFTKNVLMPVSNKLANGKTEIADDKAWEIVKEHFPKWLEKRCISTWQEVVNYVDSHCYSDGDIYLPYAGASYSGQQMYEIAQYDYQGVMPK